MGRHPFNPLTGEPVATRGCEPQSGREASPGSAVILLGLAGLPSTVSGSVSRFPCRFGGVRLVGNT